MCKEHASSVDVGSRVVQGCFANVTEDQEYFCTLLDESAPISQPKTCSMLK